VLAVSPLPSRSRTRPLRAFPGAQLLNSEGNHRKLPECSSRFPQAPGFPRESPFDGGRHDAKLANGGRGDDNNRVRKE